MLLRPIFRLAVLLPLLFPVASEAAVLDQVREDFRPISGYVVMPVDGSYLIDLDAASGVQIGDLFSVLREGEKIIHPVTREVLGTLDEVRNILQVTRIKSGYSYARPLGGEGPEIARGEPVRRYANLPATFWDYTGRGEKFYAELKAALPHIEWPGYEAAQAGRPVEPQQVREDGPRIYFLLRHDGLQVRGPGFDVLRSYPAPKTAQAAPAKTPSIPVAAPEPPALPGPAAAAVESPVTWERGAATTDGGAAFPEFRTLEGLPEGTVMADFLAADNQLLLATTNGSEVRIFSVGKTLTEVASGDTKRPGKILSVHWWRPEAQGPLYLAVTYRVELNEPGANYVGHKPVGALFRLDEKRLVSVREGLGYLLGAFDRDCDGRKETLLGQEFDRDFFFGTVKELRLTGRDVETFDISDELPRSFAVQGSLFADLTGDGFLETATIRNRELSIYAGEKLLFDSRQQMGGSLSQMDYYVNPGLKEGDLSTQSFEVPPVARDLDGDGVPELVALASESSLLRAPGIGPGVKKVWLAAFKYRNGMFVQGAIGEKVDMPVQGFYLTDDAAYLVATEPPSMFGKKGKSHLIAFPLN